MVSILLSVGPNQPQCFVNTKVCSLGALFIWQRKCKAIFYSTNHEHLSFTGAMPCSYIAGEQITFYSVIGGLTVVGFDVAGNF